MGPEIAPPPTPDERTLAMLAHILQTFSCFIGPLVIYVVKRDSRFVAFHVISSPDLAGSGSRIEPHQYGGVVRGDVRYGADPPPPDTVGWTPAGVFYCVAFYMAAHDGRLGTGTHTGYRLRHQGQPRGVGRVSDHWPVGASPGGSRSDLNRLSALSRERTQQRWKQTEIVLVLAVVSALTSVRMSVVSAQSKRPKCNGVELFGIGDPYVPGVQIKRPVLGDHSPILIAGVLEGGPAERAGVCPGAGADGVRAYGRPHEGGRQGESALGPAESKTPSMQRNSMRENRKTPLPPAGRARRGGWFWRERF